MRLRVKEFAELTGVTERTLRYYDGIGLLAPAETDPQTGYRYYGEASFERMQEILFFRELGFSLDEIKRLLSSESFDRRLALEGQKKLLTLKKQRLDELIAVIDGAMKGDLDMNGIKNNEYEKYRAEAKARWGDTAAYAEYEEKRRARSSREQSALLEGMDEIMARFAGCMKSGAAPDSAEAQGLVSVLKDYVTENFYVCTDEILSGLGRMYSADERFKANIDKHGEGTAEFISAAIGARAKR